MQTTSVSFSMLRSARSAVRPANAGSSWPQQPGHGVEVVGVRVPAVQRDFHEPDAVLHQPPGHQARLAEHGLALVLAFDLRPVGGDRRRLSVLEVERLQGGALAEPQRLGHGTLVLGDALGIGSLRKLLVEVRPAP